MHSQYFLMPFIKLLFLSHTIRIAPRGRHFSCGPPSTGGPGTHIPPRLSVVGQGRERPSRQSQRRHQPAGPAATNGPRAAPFFYRALCPGPAGRRRVGGEGCLCSGAAPGWIWQPCTVLAELQDWSLADARRRFGWRSPPPPPPPPAGVDSAPVS